MSNRMSRYLDCDRGHSIFGVQIVLLIGALMMRITNLDLRALWWDEGRNIFFSRLDWVAAAQTAIRSGDTNPPIYRMILGEWMGYIGTSPFAIRLFSVLMGVITVAILYRLGGEIFGRRVANIAGIMAAVSPALVHYSREAKGYSLLILAVSLSVLLWLQINRTLLLSPRETGSSLYKRWLSLWCLFSLVTLLAVGTHFFAFLFLLVENVWTLVLTCHVVGRCSSRRMVVHWLSWIGAQLLAITFPLLYASKSAAKLLGDADAPFLGLSLLHKLTSADLARWGATTDVGYYGEPETRLLSFLGSFVREMVVGPMSTHFLAATAVAALVPAAYLGLRYCNKNNHGVDWMVWIGIPVLLSAIFVLRFSYFYPRLLIFVVPAILLPSAAGLEWLLRRQVRVGVTIVTLIAVSWVGTLQLQYSRSTDLDEDWRPLIAAFASHQRPGDLVIHSYDWIEGYLYSYLQSGSEPDYLHYVKGEEDVLASAVANHNRMWFMDYLGSPFNVGNQAGEIIRSRAAAAYSKGFGNAHLTLFILPSYVLNTFDVASASSARFESGIGLQWTPVEAEVNNGDAIAVELVWQAPENTLPQYQVFLHVVDRVGRLITNRDSGPVNDLRPTHSWAPHERVPSLHALLLPADLPEGSYQIRTGLYDLDNGIRQSTTDGGESVLLGSISLLSD